MPGPKYNYTAKEHLDEANRGLEEAMAHLSFVSESSLPQDAVEELINLLGHVQNRMKTLFRERG